MTVSIRQRVRWPSWGTSIGFPRNSFGNTRHMFATDRLALRFARIAVDRGLDVQIEQELRVFFYLPFEHSEDLEDEDRALRLCHASLDAEAIRYAHIRQDIITARFGRFPHRNPGFGRDMTPEEQAFLEEAVSRADRSGPVAYTAARQLSCLAPSPRSCAACPRDLTAWQRVTGRAGDRPGFGGWRDRHESAPPPRRLHRLRQRRA